jgi:hypothetical protein
MCLAVQISKWAIFTPTKVAGDNSKHVIDDQLIVDITKEPLSVPAASEVLGGTRGLLIWMNN